jgi:hypothetical protein
MRYILAGEAEWNCQGRSGTITGRLGPFFDLRQTADRDRWRCAKGSAVPFMKGRARFRSRTRQPAAQPYGDPPYWRRQHRRHCNAGKARRQPILRFDTGDAALALDMISCKFFEMIIGYHCVRLVKVTG